MQAGLRLADVLNKNLGNG